jgi:dTDP-4-amino-4,6-dideoxygalactose transaminase
MQVLGFNYRMSDIHAALGLSQLPKLDGFIARRREIAAYYDEAFASVPCLKPLHADPLQRARSALHLYVVDIDFECIGLTRGAFMRRLSTRNVGTQVHYLPVYRHPYYSALADDRDGQFPGAERYYRGCLSLPLFQGLTDEEARDVVAAVAEACA